MGGRTCCCSQGDWTVSWQTCCSTLTSRSKWCKKGRAVRGEQVCLRLLSKDLCNYNVYKCTKPLLSRNVSMSPCLSPLPKLSESKEAEEMTKQNALCLFFFGSSCWPPALHMQAPHSQHCVSIDGGAQCELILLSGVLQNCLSSCYCCSSQAQLGSRQ